MLVFSISYLILSFLSIFSKYKSNFFYKILKGLPVFSLILFLVLKFGLNTYKNLIIIGLMFGLVGDLFLLNKEKFFKLGLFSFLINHIFYIAYFLKFKKSLNLIVLSLITLLSIVYIKILFKKIEEKYKIPVFFYITVISVMVITCFSANLNLSVKLGAILFFISDFVLSYNKFIKKVRFSETLILSTYYAAQFLIAIGSL